MRKLTKLTCGAAVVALALAGCGSESGGDTPAQPNNNPGGAAVSVDNLTKLADLITQKSTEKQAAHVTIDVAAGPESVTGEGDMRFGDKPAMDMKLAVPEMAQLTMRFVDDVFYFQLPDELEPGKSWVKIETNGTDPLSQALGSVVKQMKDAGDPSQMIKQLQEAGEITATKSEQLDGKDTTHYTVTIDVNKVAASQQDPQLKAAMEAAAKAGISNFPIELWLDKENLPVRISINTPFTDPKTQKTEQIKVQADYTDWGKEVNVTAPPAAEVAEFPR